MDDAGTEVVYRFVAYELSGGHRVNAVFVRLWREPEREVARVMLIQ
jgi:hypothetical protein